MSNDSLQKNYADTYLRALTGVTRMLSEYKRVHDPVGHTACDAARELRDVLERDILPTALCVVYGDKDGTSAAENTIDCELNKANIALRKNDRDGARQHMRTASMISVLDGQSPLLRSALIALRIEHLSFEDLAEDANYIPADATSPFDPPEWMLRDATWHVWDATLLGPTIRLVEKEHMLPDGDRLDFLAEEVSTGRPVIIELKKSDNHGYKQLRAYSYYFDSPRLMHVSETQIKDSIRREGIEYFTFMDLWPPQHSADETSAALQGSAQDIAR